jgi:hypothetical protein
LGTPVAAGVDDAAADAAAGAAFLGVDEETDGSGRGACPRLQAKLTMPESDSRQKSERLSVYDMGSAQLQPAYRKQPPGPVGLCYAGVTPLQ